MDARRGRGGLRLPELTLRVEEEFQRLRLRLARPGLGLPSDRLTQAAFAKEIGIKPPTFAAVLHGAMPALPTLARIAAGLGVTVAYLIVGEDAKVKYVSGAARRQGRDPTESDFEAEFARLSAFAAQLAELHAPAWGGEEAAAWLRRQLDGLGKDGA